MKSQRVLVPMTLLTAVALGGCSNSGAGSVALGLKITSSQSALTETGTTTVADAGTVLPAGLSITTARLLLNEVELHVNHMQVQGRVTRGPYILTLSGSDLVAASTKTVADVTAPAGTYADFELEVEPLDTSEQTEVTPNAATSAELADFTAAGAAAIIEGTYNGTAFTIAPSFTADRMTVAPLTVAAGTALDVAVTVDASTWFVDSSGAVLDPTVAGNLSAIAQRICLSLAPSGCNQQSGAAGGGQPGRGGRHP